MKIDICLTATNTKSTYIQHIPTFINSWKRLGIYPYIVLINNDIPSEYQKYSEYITIFNPSLYNLENVNTAFISQLIRIYYPALLTNKNIIISDIDIVPIDYSFFVTSVNQYDSSFFINYKRYNGQLNICYNLANWSTWSSLFEIKTIDDVANAIKSKYSTNYDGQKNCPGWFSDQEILTETVNLKMDKTKLIFLDQHGYKLNRLDKRDRIAIVNNMGEILKNINNYQDFHITSKNTKYTNLSNKIIDKILSLEI